MTPAGEGTVRMEVRFPSVGVAGSCLSALSKIPGVLLNILRGRATARGAVYQVELSGRGAGLKEAIWTLCCNRPWPGIRSPRLLRKPGRNPARRPAPLTWSLISRLHPRRPPA